MYHVYTEKNRSELTRAHIADFKELDKALEAAQNAVEGDSALNYIIEETSGNFDSYGELVATVVLKS